MKITNVTYPTKNTPILKLQFDSDTNVNRTNATLSELLRTIATEINISGGGKVESSALMTAAKTVSFSLEGNIDNRALQIALDPFVNGKLAASRG